MKVSMIAAVARNNVIGCDNKIPWHLPGDLKRFRDITSGHAIIMGRNTFLSLPHALPLRLNIVISRACWKAQDINVCKVRSFEHAIQAAGDEGYKRVFIIGGSQVYREALPIADDMILTEINQDFAGDAYFPDWNPDIWERKLGIRFKENDIDYEVVKYQKVFGADTLQMYPVK